MKYYIHVACFGTFQHANCILILACRISTCGFKGIFTSDGLLYVANLLCLQFFSFCHAEKCLLYSMRLWGHNTNSLHVASGTIYNEVKLFCMIEWLMWTKKSKEVWIIHVFFFFCLAVINSNEEYTIFSNWIYFWQIIVWKLVHQSNVASSASSVEVCNHHDSSCSKDNRPCEKQYMAITLSRLIGHEGSIFRIAWSPDGSKLTSVSDDRRWVSFLLHSSLIYSFHCWCSISFFTLALIIDLFLMNVGGSSLIYSFQLWCSIILCTLALITTTINFLFSLLEQCSCLDD